MSQHITELLLLILMSCERPVCIPITSPFHQNTHITYLSPILGLYTHVLLLHCFMWKCTSITVHNLESVYISFMLTCIRLNIQNIYVTAWSWCIFSYFRHTSASFIKLICHLLHKLLFITLACHISKQHDINTCHLLHKYIIGYTSCHLSHA